MPGERGGRRACRATGEGRFPLPGGAVEAGCRRRWRNSLGVSAPAPMAGRVMAPSVAAHPPAVIAGLDPAIHQEKKHHLRRGWIRGSSPAYDVRMTFGGARANKQCPGPTPRRNGMLSEADRKKAADILMGGREGAQAEARSALQDVAGHHRSTTPYAILERGWRSASSRAGARLIGHKGRAHLQGRCSGSSQIDRAGLRATCSTP